MRRSASRSRGSPVHEGGPSPPDQHPSDGLERDGLLVDVPGGHGGVEHHTEELQVLQHHLLGVRLSGVGCGSRSVARACARAGAAHAHAAGSSSLQTAALTRRMIHRKATWPRSLVSRTRVAKTCRVEQGWEAAGALFGGGARVIGRAGAGGVWRCLQGGAAHAAGAYPLIELARRVEQVVEGLIVVAVREGARGRMSGQDGARNAKRAAWGAAGPCSAPMQHAHAPRMQDAHPRSASALRAAASLVSLAALRWGCVGEVGLRGGWSGCADSKRRRSGQTVCAAAHRVPRPLAAPHLDPAPEVPVE